TGLTLDGPVAFTASSGSALNVQGTQPITTPGGTGLIWFQAQGGGGGGADGVFLTQNNTTLTLGPGLTVRGGRGTLGAASGVPGTSIVNNGTMKSTANCFDDGLAIYGASFTNAAPGAAGPGTPGGRLRATTGGSQVTLGPTSWVNQGSIELSAGTLNLGGSFTNSGLGTVIRTNGTA